MKTFYTWRDIQSALTSIKNPPWIHVEIDLTTLIIHAPRKNEDACKLALKTSLGAAFDAQSETIDLFSSALHGRSLKVIFEDSANEPQVPVKITVPRPLWSNTALLSPPEGSDDISLCAFYSYKGGVGRTTALVAVLGSLLDRNPQPKVLVIDADIEAPGLTWLLNPSGENRFSFLDMLALLHDAEDWRTDALPLLVQLTKGNRCAVDLEKGRRDFYFLPAIRNIDQVFQMPVTPEQVIRGRRRAWLIGDMLLALAKELEVQAVLVDMRAGITEFSSPFVLDPRFKTTLITSCNQQSVQGTIETLNHLGNRFEHRPGVEILITLIPPEGGNGLSDEISEQILRALIVDSAPGPKQELLFPEMEEAEDIGLYRSGFAQQLLHYDDFPDLLKRLGGTDLAKITAELAEKLVPENRVALPEVGIDIPPSAIAIEAAELEFAEGNAKPGLLPTSALLTLANQPGNRLANNVVLGSKGSGKTFAWGQMVIAGSWDKFLSILNIESKNIARIFPLLSPISMKPELLDCVLRAERSVAPSPASSIQDLKRKLETLTDVSDALAFWTRAIADRLGIAIATDSVRDLVKAVDGKLGPIVLVVDGLEEAFQVAPDKPLTETQRRLIRGLLQDLPASLNEMSYACLGLVVFIRKDLAANAISQNFSQFEGLHRGTALTWSPADALRLPLWLLQRVGSTAMSAAEIPNASYERLRQALIPFWGEKLGGKREAFTDKWVLAALSDLNLVLQARDMIRLIRFAAEDAGNALPLSPRAIRDALPKVSKKKIAEFQQEVPALKPIFDKLRQQSAERRQVPFLPDEVGLSLDEVKFLEQQGLVTRLQGGEEFYMPEIVRHGLGFRLGGSGKAKVVALHRAALARRTS